MKKLSSIHVCIHDSDKEFLLDLSRGYHGQLSHIVRNIIHDFCNSLREKKLVQPKDIMQSIREAQKNETS